MVQHRIWFDRRFALGLPVDAFPDIVERLRGTPARLEERLHGLTATVLTRRDSERWSVQENVGHLLDLEALWDRRLDDFDAAREILAEADLQNRATHEANHNARPIADLLAAFRRARGRILDRLEALDDDALRRTALHPRLQQPMTVVDLAFFVAEHDDHHLARISELLRRQV